MSLPMLERSDQVTPSLGSSPQTPNSDDLEMSSATASPASGKSTWRERQNTRGTIMKEGDIGDG
jgi:serine/threonine-protein kinase 24/25/MST4